jgi:hypothetical protein
MAIERLQYFLKTGDKIRGNNCRVFLRHVFIRIGR